MNFRYLLMIQQVIIFPFVGHCNEFGIILGSSGASLCPERLLAVTLILGCPGLSLLLKIANAHSHEGFYQILKLDILLVFVLCQVKL
jgi:hypothetical protein